MKISFLVINKAYLKLYSSSPTCNVLYTFNFSFCREIPVGAVYICIYHKENILECIYFYFLAVEHTNS